MFAWVDDLACYPRWLDIVPSADPAPAHPDDPGPAWFVTLRAKMGPLARAKRLRMVRTEHVAPTRAVFERAEHDGKDHATWRLSATVTETADGSSLQMALLYSGSLWVPLLDRVLTHEIEGSRPRLLALIHSA